MKEIRKFINGFKNFRDEYYFREDSPFIELQKHQNPSTMVIACSDSRTDPSLILQCEPGEIFVVRNIANIVPPYEPDSKHHGVSSALEYAVKFLKVQNIMILGHSSCGGIKSLMENKISDEDEFISMWLSILSSVRDKVFAQYPTLSVEACTACEMAGILHSMNNLLSFPWVAEQVKNGNLEIHGWYFDLKDGQLLSYNDESHLFEPLTLSYLNVKG
ncbi:carbonic anhydrase [Maridesulfovibrio ferrireducens]|uniref:carbonic anhydrase n=1 Tax=Maridesulfovibrio ferrireducens TaxID=246191 RepID=UPI001A3062CC|nr:carbonic anhydrase [Maridesulfovibrio ferrireducens]MBI9111929.1 carbonic anhydrase [Maridesulfovibrio ferrireducens]